MYILTRVRSRVICVRSLILGFHRLIDDITGIGANIDGGRDIGSTSLLGGGGIVVSRGGVARIDDGGVDECEYGK